MKNTKRIIQYLSIALLMVVCVIGAIMVSPIKTDASILPDERQLVIDLKITGLETPKLGETPDFDVEYNNKHAFSNPTVKWYSDNYSMGSNETFQRGYRYLVNISFNIDLEKFHFLSGGKPIVYLNGSTVSSTAVFVDENTNTVVVSVDYGTILTNISSLDITYPGDPTYNEKLPSSTITMNDGFRVVRNGWYDANGKAYSADHTVTDPDAYYEYIIELQTKFGYKFNPKSQFSLRSDGDSVYNYTISDDRQTLTFIMPYGNPELAKINDFDLEIDLPIANAKPDFTASGSKVLVNIDYADDRFVNGIAWVDKETGKYLTANDKFVGGRTYTLRVSLDAARGYQFIYGYNLDYFVNGQDATYGYAGSHPFTNMLLETEFTVAEPIKNIKLQGYKEPVAGEKPNYDITSLTDGVSVTRVFWYKNGELMDENHTFQYGNTYGILVEFKTTGDRPLAYDYANYDALYGVSCGDFFFTVNEGVDVNPKGYYAGSARYVVHCDTATIKEVGLGGIDAPQIDAYPDFKVNIGSSLYSAKDGIYAGTVNGIRWIDFTDGGKELTENDSFKPNHRYRVIIYLEAKEGSSFAYNSQTGLTVTGVLNGKECETSMVTDAHNTICVFMDFTCPKEEIHRLDLTIPVPVVGEKPDYSGISTDKVVSNQNYTSSTPEAENGVLWYDSGKDGAAYGKDDLFRPNTKIGFTTVLNPTDSYTFASDLVVYINGEPVDSFFLIGDALVVGIELTPKTCDTCILELVLGTAPTCTEEGIAHSYTCTKCGQNYMDSKGTKPIYAGDEVEAVPALGHRYGNAVEELSFDGAHLAYCLECGAEGRVDCNFIEREVYGPSQYSRFDATVTSCSECYRVYSVEVEEWACEGEGHALREWMPVTSLGEHTGIHFKACDCGAHAMEEECTYSVVIVKGPYNGIDRDVMLYVCDLCGGESMAPVEISPEQEYKQEHVDSENGIILDFHENPDTSIHPSVEITIDRGEENDLPESLIDEINVKFDDNTSIYVWFNVNAGYDGYPVAPGGEYVITVSAPIKYDEHTKTRVCIISDDGRIGKVVEPTVNGESVTFTTDTFGQFVVVGDEDPMYILTYQLKGGGQGTQPGDMFYPGDSFVLEDCTLIPDEGFRFKCWEIDGVEYNPGDTIIVNKDTYVYTVWERIPAEVHQHSYVDGVCECGKWDPDYNPEQPVNPDPTPEPDPTPDPDPNPDPTPDPEPEAKDHSQCKANGWVRFWTAIGNFFRMIFGMPKLCVCGDKLS